MAFLGEYRPYRGAERRLQQHFLTRMPEPGRFARFLYIHSEINSIDQSLDVALRLIVAAHDPKGPHGLSTPQYHAWNERMERPLARGDNVRVAWIQFKQCATILQDNPCVACDQSGSEIFEKTID